MSFVASLLAKEYLVKAHPGLQLDAASKSQSAPGLDIDVQWQKSRIVGEVKTVYPYLESDFGAAQREAFFRDFEKLRVARADFKYLFLAEPQAFAVVRAKYCNRIRGVTVVSLLGGRAFSA